MESHLLQMRGLKQQKVCLHCELLRVASFTDAWIETKRTPVALNQKDSRIFYRCVD